MTLTGLLALGAQALTRNRLRSVLTTLGIVIGVAAVIATLAIGQGARAAVQAQIRALGANTMTVIQEFTSQTSNGTGTTAQSIGELANLANEMRRSVEGFKLPDESRAYR